MKAVLRSIKPYYFYLICERKKRTEIGKDMPKAADWNRIVELYCSKDMRSFSRIPKEFQGKYRPYLGKVGARFLCDDIYDICYLADNDFEGAGTASYKGCDITQTCLSQYELLQYGKGKPLYGWHISDLKIYDKPKELREFYRKLPDKILEEGDYDCRKDWDTLCLDSWDGGGEYCQDCPYGGRVYLTRPPQSWCYVEQKE